MEWQIDESQLKYLGRLGSGSCGEVHHVIWTKKDGTQHEAAAKKFKKSSKKKDIKAQTKELNLLRKLRHPNIVEFFCAVLSPVTIIVTELAKNGSLYEYLKEQTSLPLRQVYDWALEASKAVQYIHDRDVLHRDIKSGNFVISKDNVLKLCDFGISKNVVKTVCTDFELGTIPWMAPETFVELKLTKASDVYSLSIVIWELLSCEIPYANRGFANIIWSVQIHKLRPDIPKSCPIGLRHLLEQCWSEDASSRPKAGDVVCAIKNMQQGYEDGQNSQVPSSPTQAPNPTQACDHVQSHNHVRSHGEVSISIPESPEDVTESKMEKSTKSMDVNQNMCIQNAGSPNKDYVTVPISGLPPSFQPQCTKPPKDFVVCIPDPSMPISQKAFVTSGPTHIVINREQIAHDKGSRWHACVRYLQILSCLVVLALVACLLLHCGNELPIPGDGVDWMT